MIRELQADVVVLGAGPAGLAAACSALEYGADVVLVEREEMLGGILKQCIHDGFGLERYKKKLTGPEYALHDIVRFKRLAGRVMMETFVSKAQRVGTGFLLSCVDRKGVIRLSSKTIVLATGCRERTDRQVFVHGERPAGIYSAGLAQYMINIQGLLPGRRAIILGSGDIGLIMARRMTLEGMDVLGAHEIKSEPSGLSRNVRQCLEDYSIPLELSSTVKSVHGSRRVTGVTTAKVDGSMRPIPGSERDIPCDTLVLSVGLIPENELAQSLGVPLDPATKGPSVDQNMHTLVDGVFACGNAVHVNDLVDYVSESGEAAGLSAALYAYKPKERRLVPVKASPGMLYCVPQFIDTLSVGKDYKKDMDRAPFYFRSLHTMPDGATLRVLNGGGHELLKLLYPALRPPEMERIGLSYDRLSMLDGGITLMIDKNGLDT